MSELKRIVKLAEILVTQTKLQKDLEAKLKIAKADVLRTEREDLPALMEEVGLKEVTLEDGSVIKIVGDVSAGITAKTKTAALDWLLKNNFGGLIKTNIAVSFGRGERDEAEKARDDLTGKYSDVALSEAVHPATLKSFVKEQLAEGKPVPFDLFNVHPYNKATLKLGAK